LFFVAGVARTKVRAYLRSKDNTISESKNNIVFRNSIMAIRQTLPGTVGCYAREKIVAWGTDSSVGRVATGRGAC
jgi:hypothetical protein